MKLPLLTFGLLHLLINALPIAEPARTACYAEIINGVSQEVCTGLDWHPPKDIGTDTTDTEEASPTTTTTNVYRRAAEPARTACYVEKVNGVDMQVCTGDNWHPPTNETSSTAVSEPAGVTVLEPDAS